MKMGSRSTYVLVLQDALNALGYNARYLDGIFGNATKDALVRFQRNNGLSADGICGCSSWSKAGFDGCRNREDTNGHR